MKRWLALVLVFGLMALAAPLPQVYDRLEEALKAVRLENPTQALSALDRAQSLLRQEGEGLPPVLRDAVLTHLQDLRQAVLRKSQADLEARLFLVRHLMGKALYDGFFQAAQGEKAPYLSRLARATGLPQALVKEASALPAEEARRRLEAHYLQEMAEDLGRALAAPSRPQAYLALARAYARFLVVQDSPQGTLKAQDFVQALAQVSGGEAFRPQVQALQEKAGRWRQSLRPRTEAPSSPAPAPSPSPPPPTQTTSSPSTPPPPPTPSQVRLAEPPTRGDPRGDQPVAPGPTGGQPGG